MSIRAQREQMKKLGIKDRKLARLFFNKDTNDKDLRFLNYVYEERQNLNFFYSGGSSVLLGVSMNYLFFRHNTFSYQFIFASSIFLISHIFLKRKIEYRFNALVDPYFEKYEIK